MKKFKRIKPRKMKKLRGGKTSFYNSDSFGDVASGLFWAVVLCLVLLVGVFTVKFVSRKTSSGISSYQAWKQEAKESEAAQKEIRVRERAVVKEKRVIASKKAEKEKAAAAEKRKIDAEVKAVVKEKIGIDSSDEEFGDLMFHANGRLRDPCPDDAYTASQTYWILALFILGFFIWAGIGTQNKFGFIFSIIMCIVALIGSLIVWSW